MNGLHLCADLRGCDAAAPWMQDPAALQAQCERAVAAAGLHAVGRCFHRFGAPLGALPTTAGGVTGVLLLAESHLAVHTWPERAGVTLDVYVCNLGQDNSTRAHALLDDLLSVFQPQRVQVQQLQRGQAEGAVLKERP